jgi:tubulin-specific chaperone A
MAPSQLQIATSSLQRLLKEEASYYKEQEQQEARISKLVGESSNGDTDDHDDGNREYVLKQEVRPHCLNENHGQTKVGAWVV